MMWGRPNPALVDDIGKEPQQKSGKIHGLGFFLNDSSWLTSTVCWLFPVSGAMYWLGDRGVTRSGPRLFSPLQDIVVTPMHPLIYYCLVVTGTMEFYDFPSYMGMSSSQLLLKLHDFSEG
jgi:hypothetical protein